MSTNPNGRQSGLNVSPVACLTTGTKVFSKAVGLSNTPGANDTASEPGDTIRFIKNVSTTDTIRIAETLAGTQSAATSWPLGPGEPMTILGPSGFGWGGDLYGAGVAGTASLAIFKA